MSCGAKPSVQISGTRGQGLGSHLCGRISVTRCIPDVIRRYGGLYQKHGARANALNTVYLSVVRRQKCALRRHEGGRTVETHKLEEQDTKDLTPESGVGMEKVEHCDTEGGSWGDGGGISL